MGTEKKVVTTKNVGTMKKVDETNKVKTVNIRESVKKAHASLLRLKHNML